MKISVDGAEVFELSETQKKVIKHEIPAPIFEADMKRRLHWVLNQKYEQCFNRFRNEWEKKLIAEGVKSLPTDRDEFAKLVFAHPEYKDRYGRDKAALDRANENARKNNPDHKDMTLNYNDPALNPFMKSAD